MVSANHGSNKRIRNPTSSAGKIIYRHIVRSAWANILRMIRVILIILIILSQLWRTDNPDLSAKCSSPRIAVSRWVGAVLSVLLFVSCCSTACCSCGCFHIINSTTSTTNSEVAVDTKDDNTLNWKTVRQHIEQDYHLHKPATYTAWFTITIGIYNTSPRLSGRLNFNYIMTKYLVKTLINIEIWTSYNVHRDLTSQTSYTQFDSIAFR